MNFRIECRIDERSSQIRWIVAIKQDGERLRQFKKRRGLDVRDEMIRTAARWSGMIYGHPGPTHYHFRILPGSNILSEPAGDGTWGKRLIRPLFTEQ